MRFNVGKSIPPSSVRSIPELGRVVQSSFTNLTVIRKALLPADVIVHGVGFLVRAG